MEQIDTSKPWNRTIFVVSPDDPLPPAEDQVMAAAEAGLWRCAYFYPTLKAWRFRGWRGLSIPEIDASSSAKLVRGSEVFPLEGEALVLHPVFHDRYVRLWDLEREMLATHILALCALARRQGAVELLLTRVVGADRGEMPRYFPFEEASRLGLPVEDPRFLLGVGAPVPAFGQPLHDHVKAKLFTYIKRHPRLAILENICRTQRTGGLGYCLEQEPFVPRFFELSQALAKLGCRPFSPRSQPGWKLALGITWFFEIRFDGGPDA